jgi:16S rRNA processing protein RimM
VRGWVTVTPTTDEPERRFAVGSVVLADRKREVLEARFGPKLAVLFDGCTSREDAEALRGVWLHCDVEGDPEDPDEFYDHQLEGLSVVVAGVPVGTVVEVLHLPGQDLLDVKIEDRRVLVPFVEQWVPVVDVAAGRVEVHDLEGLFGDED